MMCLEKTRKTKEEKKSMILIDELPEPLVEKYCEKCNEERADLLILRDESPDVAIPLLLEDYQACKLLLAEQEFQKEVLSLEYDEKFTQLKQEYMKLGDKSTEAKEKAKNELTRERIHVLEFDRNISLLKAQIHTVEYKLRLKFHQYPEQYAIKELAKALEEARKDG